MALAGVPWGRLAPCRQALAVAAGIGAADHTLSIIRICAVVLEARGERTRNAELFAFLASHDPIPDALKHDSTEHIDKLSMRSAAGDVEAGVARGQSRTLEDVVEELLPPEGA